MHYWAQGDGPFGGGELYRDLLTDLAGGGSAAFRFAATEFEDVWVFGLQKKQAHRLEFKAKHRGHNAATLSLTDWSNAASNCD